MLLRELARRSADEHEYEFKYSRPHHPDSKGCASDQRPVLPGAHPKWPHRYTPPRSRLTTSTSGCAANHWRTLSASRSASRSTILCVSRFTRMLPKRLPRLQLQSSTPTTRTWPTSGRGTRNSDQSTLASEMGMPSLSLKRSPPFPHVANPISCTDVRSRFVRREETSMKSGSCSVKILRGTVGAAAEKLPHGKQQANGLSSTRKIPRFPSVRAVDC